MANFRKGYEDGARMAAEMNGETYARGGKVGVKHVRKAPMPMAKPPMMPAPMPMAAPPGAGMGLGAPMPGMKKGGKVAGYAKGGAVKKGNWIADATKNKGGLHKSLGVKAGEKIPAKKIASAAEKGGKVGKQARLAETLKGMKKAKGGAVHADAKQDSAMLKSKVKSSCMKGK